MCIYIYTHIHISMYASLVLLVVKKKPACQCSRCKRHGFNPWVGKIAWRRAWQSTPAFLSGESHAKRSLADCSPQDCRVRQD